MTAKTPKYLSIPPEELGHGQSVHVTILGDMASVARHMAEAMAGYLRQAQAEGRGATLIIPVGPVDQFAVLAAIINEERLSLRDTVLINMDEYLTDHDQWVPLDHPLSFRGYMDRAFYSVLDEALAPPESHRVFPDPKNPADIGALIADRGGVDACFGGIGINGHIAFNEPPEPLEDCDPEEFAQFPTRVLPLSRETRTINAVTVGGDIAVIPERCVTVGMQEILSARALRFYCNRPWQSGVVRRVLHGPIAASCPASLLRLHADASLTMADYVAATPVIGLR